MRLFTTTFAAGLMALSGMVAPAFAETTVELEVLHKIIKVAEDGTREVIYEPVETAVPGEGLVYRLSLKNTDPIPARSLGMTLPIDANLLVDPASVTSEDIEVSVNFSVDGGANFAPFAELMVVGENGPVPAQPHDLTHMAIGMVELPAGANAVVEYDAVIR